MLLPTRATDAAARKAPAAKAKVARDLLRRLRLPDATRYALAAQPDLLSSTPMSNPTT
jgi:hypothetical protein